MRGGQVTIPAAFRHQLGIGEHCLRQVTLDQGELRSKPMAAPDGQDPMAWFKQLYDYFAPVREETTKYSDEEINAAIDEAVKRVRERNA